MKFVKIKSIIKESKKENTFDIETEDDHSFFGNKIGIHNSFSPNLQNFPKQGPEGKAFRKIFVAPEDYIICEADYSGFQLRLMGIYSNDENMIHAFSKIGDLHSVTGNSIFCNEVSLEYFIEHKKEEPYKTGRFNGKTTNLAFAFCQSPYSFQTKIRDEWTEEHINAYIKNNKLKILTNPKTGEEQKNLTVATEINRKYFETYPQLKEYQTKRQEKACNQGYVDCSIFPGARRHLPELIKISDNLDKERNSYYSTLKKIAVNAEAQAGEALNVYIALRKIQDQINSRYLKSRPVGCVHDSIVLYIHKSEIEVMYEVLKNSMERFDYTIPIVAEIEMGKVWGFGEEVTEKNIKTFLKS